jgi:hypothetical protein
MRHPFDLDKDELQTLDLNSLKDLTDPESESISGGQSVSQTLTAVGPGESGESGGHASTMAVGEEGGDATTLAVGEEGGGWSVPWPDMPSPF